MNVPILVVNYLATQLAREKGLLAADRVQVQVYQASDSSLDEFCQVLLDNWQQADNYVLAWLQLFWGTNPFILHVGIMF